MERFAHTQSAKVQVIQLLKRLVKIMMHVNIMDGMGIKDNQNHQAYIRHFDLSAMPRLSVSLQDDPCNSYRMLYDDGGRSIKCDLYYSESHDRFIAEGWRRVQLESTGEDLTMPTECVSRGFCGSHSNVWLNGSHPTVEDGIVDRMGCLSMFSSCCKVKYPIQIKNCTDYMVYNLKRTLGSDERYCFGDSTLCKQTTVSPTTKSRTSTLTTKTLRSTTTEKTTYVDDNQTNNVHSQLGLKTDYKSEELVLILSVCLSVTIALLIILAVGVLCCLRKRNTGQEYEPDTKPIKA
ncbi:hypothetical protein LOTGIDRAFT_237266 [Lottia gigantea]|uniref:UMOD/GP2/OIT3-like D8C domain-containing protein n=1 Tax=Lottia gigantea TaxID=225164 RepID=V4BFS6_LOTGI|nr:hypothetical protein LOTGIDRAFT_237266 [Lottia gigantea]ESP04732.1 hypothetical protein LOTGIDRAFT_237266 [Lottia gigantea]